MARYMKVTLISFISTLEYRMDFFLDLISKFFPALIQCFMWTAIFANSTEKIIMNYTYHQIMVYTTFSIFTTAMVSVNIHWKIAEEIKNGNLSKYLILPIKYFGYKVFQFLGIKIMEVAVVFLGIVVVATFFRRTNYVFLKLENIVFYTFFILLGLILQFLIYYCVSCLAFWMGECGGVFIVIQVTSSIVSGAIFPLDVFGSKVLNISRLLPFYYITYFPTNIMIGKITVAGIYSGILVMGVWIILLSIVSYLLWNRGMKRYIAMGG